VGKARRQTTKGGKKGEMVYHRTARSKTEGNGENKKIVEFPKNRNLELRRRWVTKEENEFSQKKPPLLSKFREKGRLRN